MFGDIFKTKLVEEKALLITATISAIYPPELGMADSSEPGLIKEGREKLLDATGKANALMSDITREAKLGYYNRYRLYKYILKSLIDLNYSRDVLSTISWELKVSVTGNKSVFSVKPDYAEAFYFLGNYLGNRGRIEEAITSYRRSLTFRPDFAETCNNLGLALQVLGHNEEALTWFKKALDFKPDLTEAQNNLGNLFLYQGQGEAAITCYEQYLSVIPGNAETHNNLGFALQGQGRYDEAITHYEQAIQLKPELVTAYLNMGDCLQEMGRHNEAIGHYEKVLAYKPDYAVVHRHLSVIRPARKHIPVIEQLLGKQDVTDEDAMNYHYALGNILNTIKSYNGAFQHIHAANSIRRKTVAYDAQAHSAFIDKLIHTYTKDYFRKTFEFGSSSELPVFIIGMPRSGTTLVEQIISSHPEVYGSGELDYLSHIETAITEQLTDYGPYPECMSSFDEPMAREYSSNYLEKIEKLPVSNVLRITDKMPGNFMYTGLIKTLFRKARIIHCRRDARDTCVSIYLTFFNYGHNYSLDLKELGRNYLDYERLMKHWIELFPGGIFEVQYEQLVNNQEYISRKLIEYLGLEWDEKCLEFYKNIRAVRTASNLQVRLPMYKESIGKWKLYEKDLKPLIEALEHSY